MNKYGSVVLNSDGLLQTWQEGRADNVDINNPLVLNVYLPQEVFSIHKAILRFRLQAFRAYETGASSGGGSTTSSGGSTTKTTDSQSLTNTSSGINVDWVTATTTSGGTDNHTHNFQRVNAHNHDMAHSHSVSIPSHTHYVSSHTHSIIYGIYQGETASSVTIKVNGIDRTSELGGTFSTDQSSLNLSSYMVIGQWNTIELGSATLGRIDANVFLQALTGWDD